MTRSARARWPNDVAVADGVLQHRRDVADVHAAGDDLGQPERQPSVPRVTISGGILALAISKPLSRPQREPDPAPTDDADEGGAPAVAADGLHHLGRDHAGEHQHRADRQVDARR